MAGPYSVASGAIVPNWLLAADHPWLQALIDVHDAHVGSRWGELRARLREPLPFAAPRDMVELASAVLGRMWMEPGDPPVRPSAARAALFTEAARCTCRNEAIARAADSLGVPPAVLMSSLFSDLPFERIVGPRPALLSAADLALRSNLALAQSLVRRSIALRILIEGNSRAIVRQALLGGLICSAVPGPRGSGVSVRISGPLSLFRRTTVYGRVLAQLVPMLAWCNRYDLRAECDVDCGAATLRLSSGDPIFPAAQPRKFDSKIEERFAADFARAAPDWDVIREPEPVASCGTLVFPDFALQHRRHRDRRWLLEIAGFWTPGYVSGKMRRLRESGLSNLILCIDASRKCADGDLPAGVPVIRYSRRVDPAAVIAIIDARASG